MVCLHLKQNKGDIMKNMKIFKLLVLIIFISTSFVYAKQIKNNNVSLRQGAGAFFPVISVLNKGDNVSVLNDSDHLLKIKVSNGKTGWISSNAFNSVGSSIDYGAVSSDLSGRTVSKLMVTAAVKGFFENKINSPNLNQELLSLCVGPPPPCNDLN